MAIPEALLAFVIIVVLPIRGWHAHHLLERANNDPAVRELLLRRSAVIKWFLAIVAFALLVADDRLGVLLFGPEVAGALFITVGLVGGALIMRRRLSSPQGQERLVHQLRKAASILPYTAEERRRWVWFSVTAGVTEEVIFRAYLIAYLYVVVVPGAGWAVAALLAAVVFGSVHAYQGARGVVLTGILGLLLGLVYPALGLVVLAIAHTFIDLRLLLVPRELIGRARAEPAT